MNPEPIKDAADLLSRFPCSGRHFRHNHKLYAAHHVLQFAKECSRVAGEKARKAIGDLVVTEMEAGASVQDLAKKIAGININDLIK